METANYLNSTVWCRLGASPIHGVGVFAIRDIPKGQQITDYNHSNIADGVPLLECDESEFVHILEEIRELILDRMLYDASVKSKLKFVSPNHDQCLQSFMNHSDDPNTDGLRALRDIKKGEEVTEDFHQLFDTPHALTKQHHHFLWKTTHSQGVVSQENRATQNE